MILCCLLFRIYSKDAEQYDFIRDMKRVDRLINFQFQCTDVVFSFYIEVLIKTRD